MVDFCNYIWQHHEQILFVGVILGGLFGLYQYLRNRLDNKLNNELTGIPDFYFTAPNRCERFGVGYCSGGDFTPELAIGCDNKNTIYWFNLVNCGKFAARQVKIAIATQSEIKNILDIDDERWVNIDYWGGMPATPSDGGTNGDLKHINTALYDIKIHKGDQALYVLLEYKSAYSKIKYKRVYKWCISDKTDKYSQDKESTTEEFRKMQFDRPVSFRDVAIQEETSNKTIGIFTRIKTKALKITSKRLSIDEWLRDY